MQQDTNPTRDSVLRKIAHSLPWMKVGRVEYRIAGKRFHIKVKSGKGPKYPFNINPTVLSADFEVLVCGSENIYYVLPHTVIKQMYTDPHAMPDHSRPGYTIYDVHPSQNKIIFGTGGRELDITKYKNSALDNEGNIVYQDRKYQSLTTAPIKRDIQIA